MAARAVNQRLGPQIWPDTAWARLGYLSRAQGLQRGPGVLCELSRRGNADREAEFQPNGFQIAVQYYNFLRLGFDGYQRVMRHRLDNAIALRKLLVESGYFKIMNESQRIPVVAVTLDEKAKRVQRVRRIEQDA